MVVTAPSCCLRHTIDGALADARPQAAGATLDRQVQGSRTLPVARGRARVLDTPRARVLGGAAGLHGSGRGALVSGAARRASDVGQV